MRSDYFDKHYVKDFSLSRRFGALKMETGSPKRRQYSLQLNLAINQQQDSL